MITRLPFLFYVPDPKNPQDAVGAEDVPGVETGKYVVKIAEHDYSYYDSKWMGDPELGDSCLVPDVDLTIERYIFGSEQEALEFIKEWWRMNELVQLRELCKQAADMLDDSRNPPAGAPELIAKLREVK